MQMKENVSGNPNSAAEPTKIWNAVFVSVFLTNLLYSFGLQMCNSMVPKYADYLGAAPTIVGTVASIFSVSALIFKLFAAPAIDTYNRKYILIGAMVVMCIAATGYSVSYSVPMLMGSRLLSGVGMAFMGTCCLAMAADALPAGKLATGIGYFAIAQAVAQAIAPTIALKLLDTIGYNLTFAVAAGFMFAGVFVASRVKVSFTRVKKFKISLSSVIAKEALIPAGILLFLGMASYVVMSFLVIYGGKQGVGSNIGYYFTVYAATMLISRPLVGKLTDKFGHIKVLLPAMLCFAGSFIVISYATTLWMFLVAAFIAAFGYGAAQPAVQALAMKMVPKARRGAGSCTSYIGMDGGNLIGPVVAGFVIQNFGYADMWRIMVFPIILAAAFVIIFRRQIISAGAKEQQPAVCIDEECVDPGK